MKQIAIATDYSEEQIKNIAEKRIMVLRCL